MPSLGRPKSELVTEIGVSEDSFPITPDDDNDLGTPIRAIRAEVGGTVNVTTYTGQDRTINIKDGETREIKIRRVKTGGTASGLEGMP